MNYLIIGLGDIGSTVASTLVANGHCVYGLRRNPIPIEGVNMLYADVADASQVGNCLQKIEKRIDLVLYCVAAKAFDEKTYTQSYPQGLKICLDALLAAKHAPLHVLYVSSTSVYHQADHDWVDESSPTLPTSFSGKILLEAENILYNHKLNGTSVRFSGIYGPGRNRLIEQVMAGATAPIDPPLYTNRIHRADCIGVILFLFKHLSHTKNKISTHNEKLPTDSGYVSHLPTVLLATDCEPVSLFDVYTFLALKLNAPPPKIGPAQNRRSSKRCSNKRLIDLGYPFKYPTYQAGYRHVVDSFSSKNSI